MLLLNSGSSAEFPNVYKPGRGIVLDIGGAAHRNADARGMAPTRDLILGELEDGHVLRVSTMPIASSPRRGYLN
jgi:hypothetical protein